MSSENSSATVRPDEAVLLTKGTMENNYNIPCDRCTCEGKITCSYCLQACGELRKPFTTNKRNLCSSGVIQKQKIPECQSKEKCKDTQFNDKRDYIEDIKREVEQVNAYSNSCLSKEDTEDGQCEDVQFDNKRDSAESTKRESLQVNSESDSHLLKEETIDRQIDEYLKCIDQQDYIENIRREVEQVNSASNVCLSNEQTKDEQMDDHLGQSSTDGPKSDQLEQPTKDEQKRDHLEQSTKDGPVSDSLENSTKDGPESDCLEQSTKGGPVSGHLEQSVKGGPVSDHLDESTKNCDINSNTDSLENQKLNEETDSDGCPNERCKFYKRSRRGCKRKRDGENSCPVCGVTIRHSELESHFAREVENLSKIPKNIRKKPIRQKGIDLSFVQVRCNRENRFSDKVAKYGKMPESEIQCPVCFMQITGTEMEINEHVIHCTDPNLSDVNITECEDFEEYEFGNETRVRAISFVPGGHKALHGHSSTSRPDDEDLNVDVDDTITYGKPQYTEMDVIVNVANAHEADQMEQLRRSVLVDPSILPRILEGKRKWSDDSEIAEETGHLGKAGGSNEGECSTSEDCPINEAQSCIISSLKARLKSLEEENNKNVKCLICLEPYTKPVVSTTCWHVHCEECWLTSMGVKKLCPQCNLIVFPTDLRRIYL